MLKGTTGIVATTIALLAGAAGAAEAGVDVIETRARAIQDPAEVNRVLAKRATAAAAEEAIEALLADNKLHLDSRVFGRTSGATSGYPVASR